MRGDQRWDETWHRLQDWTGGSTPSERLAAQLLLDQGFTDLDPSHPLGGKDGGADALARRDGQSWVMAVYFPRGQQSFSAIRGKYLDDIKGVASNGAQAFAFVTNQELRRSERRELTQATGTSVEIFHLERVVAVLDQPRMRGVRQQFLGIDSGGAAPDRSALLDELWRASIARCAARWIAVGIPPLEARALAEDRTVGAAPLGAGPSDAEPLVAWTAPMGSGKSIASERHHQTCLEAAASDELAPVPVFLRASECVSSLQTAVAGAAEGIGDVRALGASVVVDGIDEVGYQAAGELLTQARVLVGTWPSTTLLMTSRAVPVLADAPERQLFPSLDDAEQLECVQIGAGNRGILVSLHSLAAPVRATMPQPFFALLVGVWMRERAAGPRAPIDLMALLGERATRDLAIDESHLRALAVRSVARELGPVPAADVLKGARPDQLLATGLLEHRGGGLAFVLPAVAQWFAAQSLLLGETTPQELLGAPEDLELWRYPLALAISLGSADQGRALMTPLLSSDAGFAMRVLEATFGHAVLSGTKPPPWREGGEQARQTLQSLVGALGPLAPLVSDVDETGRVRPMAVASGPLHLTIAFWRGQEKRPDVFAMPADMPSFAAGHEWGSLFSTQIGPGAAWAWHWGQKRIRDRLDRVLQHRALPVMPFGPLGHEAAWVAACDLVDASTLTTGAIELTPLLEALERIPAKHYEEGPVIFRKGATSHDLRGLRAIAAEVRERGDDRLLAPLPPADTISGGGGWVGDFFSDERLLELATRVYEAAIIGYRELTERWMPTMLPQLEHRVLMPMRIVGFLNNGRGQPHIGTIPFLAGYIEALPTGVADEVRVQLTSEHYGFELGEPSYAQQCAARPTARRWLTGTHGGLSFELAGRYPVSDATYAWIAQDLKRLGLVGALAHHRSSDAIVPWDL
jgi:hypothetical protein